MEKGVEDFALSVWRELVEYDGSRTKEAATYTIIDLITSSRL